MEVWIEFRAREPDVCLASFIRCGHQFNSFSWILKSRCYAGTAPEDTEDTDIPFSELTVIGNHTHTHTLTQVTLLSRRALSDSVSRSDLEKGRIVWARAGAGLLTVLAINLGKRDGIVRRLEVQRSCILCILGELCTLVKFLSVILFNWFLSFRT